MRKLSQRLFGNEMYFVIMQDVFDDGNRNKIHFILKTKLGDSRRIPPTIRMRFSCFELFK